MLLAETGARTTYLQYCDERVQCSHAVCQLHRCLLPHGQAEGGAYCGNVQRRHLGTLPVSIHIMLTFSAAQLANLLMHKVLPVLDSMLQT